MKSANSSLKWLIILFISINIFPLTTCSSTPELTTNGENKLTVALYPYLPRGDQFQEVLQNYWDSLNTGVELEFVYYDCYSTDPPDSLDVFVFDGIFYSYFQSQGYLKEIEISQVNDWMGFMSFALSAVWVNSQTTFGVPYLGCSNVYFYRKSDPEMKDALSLNEYESLIGPAKNPNVIIPPPYKGLLVDLSGGTTDACLYLMTEMDINNSYTKDPYLPPADSLDQQAIGNLQQYTIMAGQAQASYQDPGTNRIDWFNQGNGQSLIGITENLCSFSQAYLDSVLFWIMPLTDNMQITQPFYVDIASINSSIDQELVDEALLLLNLMTSESVMYNSMIPENQNENPQFLIPVRGKVLADLMDLHPLYTQMSQMILSYYAQPFLIGSNPRTWLNDTKSAIRQEILNPTGEEMKAYTKNITRPDRGSRIGVIKSK